MELVDALEKIWPLFVAMIGLCVWLVRLEGRVNYIEKSEIECQKDVDKLRTEHEALNSRMLSEIMELKQSVARIEGHLIGRGKDHG